MLSVETCGGWAVGILVFRESEMDSLKMEVSWAVKKLNKDGWQLKVGSADVLPFL